MSYDKNNENYTTYEELEQYIQDFQAGDSESGMKIINSFEGFLTDYAMLVHQGVFNIQDRKLREFVRLYMKGSHRKHVHQYKHKPTVRAQVYKTASRIHEIFQILEYSEVYQELVLSLLQLAKRYRILPDKPRFHVYVMRTYHYEARRRLQKLFYYESNKTIQNLFMDVSSYDYDKYETDSFSGFDNKMKLQEGQINHLLKESFTQEDEEVIDEEWVLGWKSSEYFSELTTLERRIVKLYYWDDYSDQEIANELGMCRVTINRYRLRAKGKITTKCEGFNILEKE